MDDDTKLRRQALLGLKAKELRENELLVSIFEGLKAQKLTEWVNCKDRDKREQLHAQLQGLIDIWEQITLALQNGEAAEVFLFAKQP
ncbi:MAG: hypothetical protein ACM3IH_14070 [Sphingobacteriales bacterium]